MRTAIKYSLIFWGIFFLVISFFLLPMGGADTVLIRVGSFVVPQMILFYLNLVFLIPLYLEQQRKKTYYVALIFIITVFTITFGYLDIYFDQIIPLDIKHLEERPKSFIYLGRVMSAIPPIIVGALIRKSQQLQQKTQEGLELENKMLEAETNALKAQINPHFLFNTLNNIYSLSQIDSKKTGDAIIQLSDILRYVTYDANQKMVPLSAEIEHINSFIKLQLLRDADDSNIDIDISIDNDKLQISPLLLIPIIENCFKHGTHHDKKNGWIKIFIKSEGDHLLLEASNSTGKTIPQKDGIGGVGMNNVKKRLSLLYPYQHDLVIRIEPFSYTAILKIKLK